MGGYRVAYSNGNYVDLTFPPEKGPAELVKWKCVWYGFIQTEKQVRDMCMYTHIPSGISDGVVCGKNWIREDSLERWFSIRDNKQIGGEVSVALAPQSVLKIGIWIYYLVHVLYPSYGDYVGFLHKRL